MHNFRLAIYEGMALYIGRDVRAKSHAHHALEIVLTLEGKFSILTDSDCLEEAEGALIASDVTHEYSAGTALTVFIYLDNETQLARQITEKLCLKETPLRALQAEAFHQERIALRSWLAEGDDLTTTGPQIIRAVIEKIISVPAADAVTLDPRIEGVLRFIEASITDQKLSISRLADVSCLSEGRLAHLFKAQTGIPVRKYILWMRIRKAVAAVLQGFDLTQAAYQAGFADSSHLSRTFLEMFGVTPSSVLKK